MHYGFHVTKRAPEGWIVVRAGVERAASVHPTQAEAVAAARRLALKSGGAEVVIHSAEGCGPDVSQNCVRNNVLAAITKYVRVAGEGEFQPESDEPSQILVSSLVVLYEVLGLDPSAFSHPKSIQELAAERGVGSAEPLLQIGADAQDTDDEAAEWIRAAKSDA